jgi:hypothetical protein
MVKVFSLFISSSIFLLNTKVKENVSTSFSVKQSKSSVVSIPFSWKMLKHFSLRELF